jgi:chromosomal replication initiator protein
VLVKEADLWQAVLGEIELMVSRPNYVTWFKPTSLLKMKDGVAVIGVPNVFVKQQMESKFGVTITEILAKNGYPADKIKLEFKTYAGAVRRKEPEEDFVVVEAPNGSQPGTYQNQGYPRPNGQNQGSISHSYRQGLNERYTFDNFVVGAGNELAHAACQGIAQMPGTKYNPLFLYGGVGLDNGAAGFVVRRLHVDGHSPSKTGTQTVF